MRKLVDGASQELVNLSRCVGVTLCCSTCLRGQLQSFCNVVTVNACSVAEVINVKILEDIFRNVEGNTKQLVDAGAVGQRSAISLSIIQVPTLGHD